MEWLVGAAVAAAISLLVAINQNARNTAREVERIRRMLEQALYPDNDGRGSDLERIRAAAERFMEWEREKRPPLAPPVD